MKKLAEGAKDVRTRLHALWTLDGIDAIEPATIVKALGDPSRDVRVSAVRIAERWLADERARSRRRSLEGSTMPTGSAGAAGGVARRGAAPLKVTRLAALLEKRGDNPVVIDAALSGLRGSEPAVLTKLLQSTAQTPAREAAITMLAATIARGAQDADVQSLFQRSPTRLAEWQRSALLRGAEVALLARRRPGRSAAAAPGGGAGGVAPQAGGGRAVSAPVRAVRRRFRVKALAGGPMPPRTGGPPAGGGGGRGGGVGVLRLHREPALAAGPARGGETGQRATALLARIEWPGKPGAAAPVAPLSAAEQARFAAGQEVYKSVCEACHQPDGRGEERVAPAFVGSALALAASAFRRESCSTARRARSA